MDPTFTPDGRHVIYRTRQASAGNIQVVDANRLNRRTLDFPADVSSFAVSPILRRSLSARG